MSDYNDFLLPEPCLRMDTHFGDEYESIEFGDGTGYVKAAPTLARLGALHVELDELRDENAKLREERDHWHVEQVHAFGNWEDSHKRAVELEAENAKLRELAAKMGEMLDCVLCDRRVGCNWRDDGPCWYEIELHELMRETGE